jgi:hypothetical protein
MASFFAFHVGLVGDGTGMDAAFTLALKAFTMAEQTRALPLLLKNDYLSQYFQSLRHSRHRTRNG